MQYTCSQYLLIILKLILFFIAIIVKSCCLEWPWYAIDTKPLPSAHRVY
jgi:hypothetical protein